MSDKHPCPLNRAKVVAHNLRDMLSPFAEADRCVIVGSVRRERPFVGDLEILYIPRFRLVSADLFAKKASQMANLADELIATLLQEGLIQKRQNVNGSDTWGELNKYCRHPESGLNVDFFATTEDCWWNNLVTRTGGKQNNIDIGSAARRLGWKYEATGRGFLSLRGWPYHQTTSERDVFEHVRLPYLEPQNRA